MDNNYQENNQTKYAKYTYFGRQWNKVIGIIVILIVLGFIAQSVTKISANYKNPSTISITGIGKMKVEPDLSTINFTIRSTANTKDTVTLQKNIAEKADSILKKLADLGIEEKDIETSNYQVNPKYDYNDGKSTIYAYEASESINVKVRDKANVSKVLDILAKENITEVTGPNFSVDDIESVKDQARDLAIKDAKEKAKDLANALGVKIERIMSYSDDSVNGGGVPPRPMMYKNMMVGAEDASVSSEATIPSGEQKIIVTANITFQIRD